PLPPPLRPRPLPRLHVQAPARRGERALPSALRRARARAGRDLRARLPPFELLLALRAARTLGGRTRRHARRLQHPQLAARPPPPVGTRALAPARDRARPRAPHRIGLLVPHLRRGAGASAAAQRAAARARRDLRLRLRLDAAARARRRAARH